jgi:hypothetical protein
MPTLETADGKPVDVTPVDTEAVNRQFAAAMADDGPDTQAPPKRQPKSAAPPTDSKPRRTRAPKAEQPRVTAQAGTVLDDGQRAQGVKGWSQIIAGVALMFGKATGKDAFKADAVTIASAADELADAAVQVAHLDPKFAVALDKVCAVGPYGALISVGVGVVSQCARNHKPSLKLPGTVDPAELLRAQDEAEAKNETELAHAA